MEIKKVFLFCCLGAILISCNKKIDPLESYTEEPVFYIQGEADHAPVRIIAGENDYYLYTFNNRDGNNIYQFGATLKQESSTNFSDEFQIIIKDYKKSAPANLNVDEALGQGNYQYYSGQNANPDRVFQFHLDPAVDTNGEFLWDFGDGITSKLLNPFHQYTHDGDYDVALKVNYGSCSYRLSRSVSLTPASPIQTKTDFGYFSNNPFGVQFMLYVTDSARSRVIWNFGDGDTSSLFNPFHVYSKPFADTIFMVTATITEMSGVSRITKQLVPEGSCTANFDSENGIVPSGGVLDFSKIIIRWKDKNGVLYTSEENDQPVWSNFSINEVISYQVNEHGEKTKKFKVEFDCAVWNNGAMKELRNMEGIIAVSYP